METRITDDSRDTVKSADRVLDLFELLALKTDGLSHTAIAEALAIPKSSLTKLLKNVVGRGYIAYHNGPKLYTLGERLSAMSNRAIVTEDLIRRVQPILHEIASTTRESAALNLRRNESAEVVATVNGPQRLMSHMHLGDLAPLYATSGGKAILASLPESEFEQYINNVIFEPITPNTISSAEKLRDDIAMVKQKGIAYSVEEFTVGIVGVANSLSPRKFGVSVSINVAIPALRFTEELDRLVCNTLRNARRKIEN